MKYHHVAGHIHVVTLLLFLMHYDIPFLVVFASKFGRSVLRE